MGSKVGKVIIPLVALGVAAWATGGFGLAGAGAGAGSGAGAAGATMGSNAASLAAAEAAAGIPTAASIIPSAVPGIFSTVGLGGPMSIAGAAGPMSAAGSVINAAGQTVTIAPATKIAAATSSGFLAGLGADISAKWAEMTSLEKVGYGFKGVSAGGAVVGSAQNAAAQKAALSLQEDDRRVREAGDRLTIAEDELEASKRLRKILAAQTVFFNATGVNPNTGSPLALQESAEAEAGSDLDALSARRSLVDAGGSIAGQSLSLRRRTLRSRRSGSFAGSLLDFGFDASDYLAGNR